MTCVNTYLFWLLLILATPGVFLSGFVLWFFVEVMKIYVKGRR